MTGFHSPHYLLILASIVFGESTWHDDIVAQERHPSNHWPQFRGSEATGVANDAQIPLQWSATENVEWKSDISGRGWGSPVVWDDHVFLTTVVNSGETEPLKKGLYFGGDRPAPPASRHQWKVVCLGLTSGEIRWEKVLHEGEPRTPIHLKNSYASESPVTDGNHVFVSFGGVGIYCLDFQGNTLWKHELPPHATRNGWGTASSPILHQNRLYYQNDNEDQSTLTAIDTDTGKAVWTVEREEESNWSTPFIRTHDLRTEIVTAGTGAVRSYDLDGDLLWSLKGMSSITIATPYEVDGLLYVSSGYILDPVKALYAIRPGGSGDLTLPEGEASSEFIQWSSRVIAPYNPSTLVHDGRLYVLYDRGMLSCFDAKTGEAFYERKKLERGVAVTASPWCCDGKVYCLNEDGVCCVVREGDTFELLSTNTLADDDICLSTPAIAGDRLLIRSDKRLYCIQNPKRR
jgi:outer membrane protein assembly factor BamB